MLLASFLLAACTTDSTDSVDGTDTADTAAGDTADTSGDPDGLFFHATGTVDGKSLTWSCDETTPGYAFYSTVTAGDGLYALGGTCADQSGVYFAEVAALTGAPGSTTTCTPAEWGVAVLNLTTSTFWNCAIDGTSAFEIVVDELTPGGDGSVVWGGTFAATSDGSSMAFEADLSGSFRWKAVDL